ncbi:MAG: GH36-type glycosyl hydrolase domain-containing protein [Sphingobacteriaceae bacterium]
MKKIISKNQFLKIGNHPSWFSVTLLYAVLLILQITANAQTTAINKPSDDLAALMGAVKLKAETLVKSGFNAGDGYGEVWIRDFNTFMEVACKVNDQEVIKQHLLTFFKFQQKDGQIIDGYIPKTKSTVGYNYYYTDMAPEYAGHKNTVETDQETSLIQAVYRYIKSTGDYTILQQKIGEYKVSARLEMALNYLATYKFDKKYGLIWGATTADWGDVQPEHEWGVELDSNSHKAIDIYDNAMLAEAIDNYLAVADLKPDIRKKWKRFHNDLSENVRKYLWDKKHDKFIPHLYLNGSPFPKTFDEHAIYYHGGTTIAIEAGFLSRQEVKRAYIRMQENVQASGAGSIGLTLFPVYPDGFFKNPAMRPYSYQNGGDWTWFGGRMVRQLVRYGFIKEAQTAILPMLQRVVNNDGFYEWYSRDNQPQGSGSFRGEAGVLWSAINELKRQK